MNKRRALLLAYIAGMGFVLLLILASALVRKPDLSRDLTLAMGLTALFGLSEYAVTFFHRLEGRVGISAAEAVLLPMIMFLGFAQVTLGVVVGTAGVALAYRRVGLLKNFFNVVLGGLAAAAGAGIWSWLGSSGQIYTARNAGVAILGVVAYALLTHVLVAGVIAISEGRSFRELARDIPQLTLLSLAASLVLGQFFATAFVAAHWTAVLFPFPLAAVYLGSRAVVRQLKERERIERLHEASRALASSAGVEQAVGSFLVAVGNIVSARELVLLVGFNGERRVSRVIDGQVVSVMDASDDDPLEDFASHLQRTSRPIVVAEAENSPWRNWADDLGAKSLIATALEDESLGCLVAMDRIGADEFGSDDAKLLEALAQELVLSLGSYRLFAQVSQERERFGRIFSGSKDGICLLDDAGKVLAWNPALERITGYQQSAVVGRELSDTLLIRDANKQRLDAWEFVGADPDAELEIVTNDGPGRWVSVLSGSVSRGKETSWVILVRDRTAEHQAEESKSDFLSTISHELRTPLTSIKGSLQVLAKGQEALPDGVHSQMVEVLQRSSDRLERLLLNLLFVSRVETDGQLSVVTQQIDLESIVRDSVSSLLGGHDDVELHIEPGMDATVNAESEGLTQAVEHLLDNARKFCSTGKITVELRRASRFAEVVVTDSGPGIPRAEQERIFERFVRLGDTLTRETQGPGVGLFIVRSVAAAVGGRAWVESEPGEGSTFHLIVPLSRQLRVAPQPAAGAS